MVHVPSLECVSHRGVKTVWEQLAKDQFDPWQAIPRQVFTPYSRLLISTASVVVSRFGCLVWV